MQASVMQADTLCPATGTSQQFHAHRGDVLVVEAGRIVLEETPNWLAETLYRAPVTLAEGEAHEITRSGWVTLHAERPARLRHYPAECGAQRHRSLREAWLRCTAWFKPQA